MDAFSLFVEKPISSSFNDFNKGFLRVFTDICSGLFFVTNLRPLTIIGLRPTIIGVSSGSIGPTLNLIAMVRSSIGSLWYGIFILLVKGI
jgi:hypothetical protein